MRLLVSGFRMRMLTNIFNFRSIHEPPTLMRTHAAAMASTTRTVLVCIGERKRPVAINHDQNEKRKWFDTIKVAFADVLEEKPIRKPVIQLKSEEWHGQFVDFQGDSLPDRAVVRVIDEVSVYM